MPREIQRDGKSEREDIEPAPPAGRGQGAAPLRLVVRFSEALDDKQQ